MFNKSSRMFKDCALGTNQYGFSSVLQRGQRAGSDETHGTNKTTCSFLEIKSGCFWEYLLDKMKYRKDKNSLIN